MVGSLLLSVISPPMQCIAIFTFRIRSSFHHHGVVHVAEEHLMGTNGSLSALHGDEGGGGGLVVCTDCQQLHSSDTL
jgi:hypothetical protein